MLQHSTCYFAAGIVSTLPLGGLSGCPEPAFMLACPDCVLITSLPNSQRSGGTIIYPLLRFSHGRMGSCSVSCTCATTGNHFASPKSSICTQSLDSSSFCSENSSESYPDQLLLSLFREGVSYNHDSKVSLS